jgi:hypothetical protein
MPKKHSLRHGLLYKVTLVCVALFCSGCAGSSAFMRPTQSLMQPTEDMALIRFMRPSGFGFAINFNMLDGDEVIGNSVAKSQFDYLATPGKHVFIATAENKAFLEADLEAGKTYYVLMRIYPGAWYARVAFVPVNKGSEYWDQVKSYENTLRITTPDRVALQKWQDSNKLKIDKLLTAYETEWTHAKDWPKLNREDGR